MESSPAAEPLDVAPSMQEDDNDSKDPSACTKAAVEESAAAVSLDVAHECVLEDNDVKMSPAPTQHIVASSGHDSGDSNSKQNGKGSGLSELSKQLRVLQAKNQSQQAEISRLERQIRILSELQGVHVGDLRRALEQACSAEAFGELQHRVAQLEAQLEATTLQRQLPDSDKSASGRAQDEATSRKVANLELRVGEMEEMEEKLRSEMKGLYSQLMDQQMRASRFESLYQEQKAETERLNVDISKNNTQTQHEMQAERETLSSRALKAEADLHEVKEKMALMDQQRESEKEQSILRLAQFKARFVVQDERIYDLEQQLSSLYVAFDLLNEESNQDEEHRSFLLTSLDEADAQVARQVHHMEKDQSIHSPDSLLDHSISSSRDLASIPTPPPQSPEATMNRFPSGAVVSPGWSSPVEEPIHSGVLYVRGASMMKKWKKRNAALYSRPDYHLLHIQDDVRHITLRFGISRIDQFHQKPFAFVIHTNPGSTKHYCIYAAASNQQEYVAWMTALEAVTSIGSGEISESAKDDFV